MTTIQTIPLGVTVRDKTSGFTGMSVSMTEFMTGNVQLSLQPPAKDGALPETIGFDIHQLETAPGPTVPCIAPPLDTGIKLGEKVMDIVTGCQGVAIRRTTFLNGCVYYVVVDENLSKEGLPIEHFLEWKRLERVSVGVFNKIVAKLKPAASEDKPARSPGGPATRGMQARG